MHLPSERCRPSGSLNEYTECINRICLDPLVMVLLMLATAYDR